MRIILYTGKGGVGKTSIAAATAVKSAREGKRTLIISADAAHSLGDSFDQKLSPEPMQLEDNLWAQEIDTNHELEQGWGMVQKYITTLFTANAVNDITTEELTIFPGIEDLLSLLRILKYYKEKTYDLIIVDCAPTGETLALLSFPDMFRWWMERFFSMKRKTIKVLKPIAEPLIGIPLPSDGVMGEFERIYNQLDEMRQIFTDRDTTSIRIVVNPEKMVVKEAQRSFTYLNIYNFNVDAIVVNRVIPEEVTDPYFSVWKDIQSKYKGMIRDSFEPVPIFQAPMFEKEVLGFDMLSRMAEEIFADNDATKVFYNQRTQTIEKTDTGYLLKIYMPFVEKHDLSLNQKGDELIIRAGLIKRTVTLPRTLRGYNVNGAKFENEYLNISLVGVTPNEE
ncbi:ArsA family ATPase [Desulfuribacillus alkaliarsenatis]|uniref:arsenite-transporting ATPase n=1 Tax=Desulfuribacillus alkaliarsenatis TaxID=766136 RepID=A0A1E5G318_9FIRM|nr:ArsA family ATPase [Desulfuribacillus alkaliarsenatis]OEF97458.1 arsenic-transporting ATPase [Desulfuribacillus alkaliarsenatis]